jgi:cobalt/nickel transport system ATP-binding protein
MTSALLAQDLTYAYGDGTLAVQNLNLRLEPGERCALLGGNGSGKTTLLLLMAGLLKGKGTLQVMGYDPRTDGKQVRRALGLGFQDPEDQLFCPTLWEDIAFGPHNQGLDAAQVHERVHQALHTMGLEGLEQRSAFHLSHGQKKRAALATVLSMQPSLLALDEPTSNLDPRARRTMLEALLELPGTLLLATHDLDAALKLCHRSVVLENGQLVYDGSTQELFAEKSCLMKLGLA